MEELRKELNNIDNLVILFEMITGIDCMISELQGERETYKIGKLDYEVEMCDSFIEAYKEARLEVRKRIVTLELIENLNKACNYEKGIQIC